jgi:hypothetical protein
MTVDKRSASNAKVSGQRLRVVIVHKFAGAEPPTMVAKRSLQNCDEHHIVTGGGATHRARAALGQISFILQGLQHAH